MGNNTILGRESGGGSNIDDLSASQVRAIINVQDGAQVNTVTPTNTVTLTNKTLTSPAINTPTGIVKGDVGLGNVDNTSDLNKPISTATQTALDAKVSDTGDSITGAYTITNSSTSNGLRVDQNGNTSASSSVGGAVLIENTGNTGAGLVVYSANATPSGHLISSRANHASFNYSTFYSEYNGTGSAVNIVNSGTGSGNTALGINSSNTANSAVNIVGAETGRGTVKISHTGTGTDASASALSIDLIGTGTAAQGIYVDSTASGGTTGNLLRLRNQTIDRFVVDKDGNTTIAGDVTVPDEAYGAGWNGSLEVPTKNAVYDKIETMGGGSGITRTVVVTSGNATAGSTASTDYVYIIAGAHTITLPTAVGNTNRYSFKNTHSSNVSLAFNGAETADGGGITLAPLEAVDLISNGTNWSIF
jgi:hypothetical protein